MQPSLTHDCLAVMGQAMVFEFGGYGPSSILRHLYLFSLRGGQRAAAAAIAAVEAAMHACFAASCLHAVHVLCAMCARMAVACDRGVLWAHTALHRASEARAGGRDTPHCLSYMHLFSLRGGQRAAAAAIAAVEAAMHACFAASCLHAVHVLCAMCARMAVACDRGVLWAHTALHRASEARAGGRDTPHCLSYMHVRVNAM